MSSLVPLGFAGLLLGMSQVAAAQLAATKSAPDVVAGIEVNYDESKAGA